MIYGFVLLALYGCKDEQWDEGRQTQAKGGMPVQFQIEYPQDAFTKAPGKGKRNFETGDVIQLSAKFNKKGGGSVCEYRILTYDESQEKWECRPYTPDEPEDGKEDPTEEIPVNDLLTWPLDAKSGEFKAYYVPEYKAMLNNQGGNDIGRSRPVSLDGLSDETDPLFAESGITECNHAVELNFTHCCTRLTLTNLNKEEEYWLRKSVDAGEMVSNHFYLELSMENDLKLGFGYDESEKDPKVARTTDSEGTITFYLEPGDYNGSRFFYRHGSPVFSFGDYIKLPEFEVNHSYTYAFDYSKGIFVEVEPDEDEWSKPDEDAVGEKGFSMKEFLENVVYGTDYSCEIDGKKVKVLEQVAPGSTRLLQNVKRRDDDEFDSVELPNTCIFDGGGHFISNLHKPLFTAMRGRVWNLGLYNVNIKEDAQSGKLDEIPTSLGALARLASGEIYNMRLIDVNVEFKIPDDPENNYNVGALVGYYRTSGTRYISDIELGGQITVTMNPKEEKSTAITFLGGVVGQCTALLNNVSMVSDVSDQEMVNSLTVKNTCDGGNVGSRYTGGLVGRCNDNGNVKNCRLTNVTVDVTQACALWNYAGGLLGGIQGVDDGGVHDGEEHQPITMVNSSVIGLNLKGGRCLPDETVSTAIGHTSTGGLVGYAVHAQVENCHVISATVTNRGLSDQVPTQCYVSVGGAFGHIQSSEIVSANTVFDVTIEDIPKDFSCLVGSFAGIGLSTLENTNKVVGIGASGVDLKFVGYAASH